MERVSVEHRANYQSMKVFFGRSRPRVFSVAIRESQHHKLDLSAISLKSKLIILGEGSEQFKSPEEESAFSV